MSRPLSWRRTVAVAVAALVAVAASLFAIITSPSAQAADSRDSFVTRCGIRFCLDGSTRGFLSIWRLSASGPWRRTHGGDIRRRRC